MSKQEISLPNIPEMVFNAFISGITLDTKMIPEFTMSSILPINLKSVEDYEITIKKDKEKEYIECDIENMIKGRFYPIEYQNELQLVKKISDDKIVFYDVIE